MSLWFAEKEAVAQGLTGLSTSQLDVPSHMTHYQKEPPCSGPTLMFFPLSCFTASLVRKMVDTSPGLTVAYLGHEI